MVVHRNILYSGHPLDAGAQRRIGWWRQALGASALLPVLAWVGQQILLVC